MVVVVVGGCVWRVAGGGQRGRGARVFSALPHPCPIPSSHSPYSTLLGSWLWPHCAVGSRKVPEGYRNTWSEWYGR